VAGPQARPRGAAECIVPHGEATASRTLPFVLRLSVVVPTHETRALTLHCVEAVWAGAEGGLGRDRLEVIVVDDASSDGTEEALRRRFPRDDDPRMQVERLAVRSGFTVAANHGLSRAAGEILLLLNSDTALEPDALQALLAAFDEDDRLGAVGAQLLDPDGSAQWSGGREPTLAWLFVLAADLGPLLHRLPGYRRRRQLLARSSRSVDWVTGAALGLRRRALDAVGLLDEAYAFYAQDLDYCCRLRRAGWKVAIDARVRVLHHRGATIGATGGTVDGKNLALLYADLLLWGHEHRRTIWVCAARRVLALGARLRLLGLCLRRLGPMGPERRETERRQVAAIRGALAAVARSGDARARPSAGAAGPRATGG